RRARVEPRGTARLLLGSRAARSRTTGPTGAPAHHRGARRPDLSAGARRRALAALGPAPDPLVSGRPSRAVPPPRRAARDPHASPRYGSARRALIRDRGHQVAKQPVPRPDRA